MTAHLQGRQISTAPASLDELTGLHSSKRSYYPDYLRSAERLRQTVAALEDISRALVNTRDGPRALLRAVVTTGAAHLRARWVVLAVADGALTTTRPRSVAQVGPRIGDDDAGLPTLPLEAARSLQMLRQEPWETPGPLLDGQVVWLPMALDGEPIGGIAALPGIGVEVTDDDVAILRVLADQAAVALHNSYLTQVVARSHPHARGPAERSAHPTSIRTGPQVSRRVHRQLAGAARWQALDDERHRIARDLHDSVVQDVLGAGLTVDACRAELEGAAPGWDGWAAELREVRDLLAGAVAQLRRAIYALQSSRSGPPAGLPARLEEMCTLRLPRALRVSVAVRGTPRPLSAERDDALAQITAEALFNAAVHSPAEHVEIVLSYRGQRLTLTIADDGRGDARVVRRALGVGRGSQLAGLHRGLANMQSRAEQLGGRLSIRRSPLDGVMVHVTVPAAGPPTPHGEVAR